MSEMIQAVVDLKTFAMKHILEYPATFHAIDVASKIVGWEEAAKRGDNVNLPKKVRQIYKEALNPPDAYEKR